jgi:RNA polymerase sigma-70 factor (ECF subfamily)
MGHTSGPESEIILRRAAEGDAAARAELLGRYRERLRRMIAFRLDKRVASRVDASDVVQESLKNAYLRLPEYLADPQESFYLWLRRIAWDRLMETYRLHITAEKRSVLSERPIAPELNDDSVCQLAQCIASTRFNPGQQAILAEMLERVHAALLKLRNDDREVLVLRYLEQLNVNEISRVLDISETAVTSRHFRALQRLREILGSELHD